MANVPDEQIWGQLGPMIDGAVMGVLGGIVNGLRQRNFKDWWQAAAVIMTAGFAGMLAHLIASWLGADVRLQFALSGIAGYSGGVLLDDIVKRVRGLMNKSADILTEKLDSQSRHGSDTEAYFVVPKWEPEDK